MSNDTSTSPSSTGQTSTGPTATDVTAPSAGGAVTPEGISDSDLADLVDRYLECWNTPDVDRRRQQVEATWVAGARMVDPIADASGHDELVAVFGMFHEMYRGHSFRRRGGIDHHHEMARWAWEMVDPEGALVLDGLDAAMLDGDRLAFVAGYFGYDVPA